TAQTNADVTQTDQGSSLQNDVEYKVQVIANDAYGNVSNPSAAVIGKPVAVLDFYGLYRHDGGDAQGGGGCSSAGASSWLLLLGGTVGFWQNFGKGLVADASGNPVTPIQQSSDTALLDVIPVGAIATYRFDLLADRWPRFPFIPYTQVGLMRALWASFSGTG